MTPAARRLFPLALAALAACATRGDVQRVSTQVATFRTEAARRDSARARQLADVLQLQQRILDSLGSAQRALAAFGTDLYSVRQQLIQVQELTGQSQRRLTELRTQLEARADAQAVGVAPPAAPGDSAAPAGAAPVPSAEQIYEASLQQFRRGSAATARAGFRELLRLHPASPRVPDATYFLAETFAGEAPDSAAARYTEVVVRFPASPRAPTALYKLGLLAERRGDAAGARAAWQRVVKEYPASDEAALAREKLQAPAR